MIFHCAASLLRTYTARRMLRRVINATAAAGSLAASAYVLADKQQQNDVRALADGFTRFCRTAYHGTVIVMDYKRNVDPLEAAHGKKSPEVLAAKKVVDLRSAQRLLELCRKHGGLYIKFAQVRRRRGSIAHPPASAQLA